MVAQFVAKDGTRLELLAWAKPGVRGQPSETRNQIGLTHLCMRVDDVEQVAARLVSFGGTVIQETRTEHSSGIKLLVVKDPDGTRVELLQLPPA